MWGYTPSNDRYLTLVGWPLSLAVLMVPAVPLWYGLRRDYPRGLHISMEIGLVGLIALTLLSWVVMPSRVG